MAEYGSSGIWQFIKDDTGPWRHSLISYDRLGLPSALADEFKTWIACYEQDNLRDELNLLIFNATGLALAYDLYKHFDEQHYVEFQGESEAGGLEEAIDITRL